MLGKDRGHIRTCKIEYENRLNQRWEKVRGEVVGGCGGGMEKV